MTRRQFKKLADEHYNNDILTPLERRRKALAMKSLSKEKIEEVQALIAVGGTKKEIAEKAGVGLSTVDRIRSGQLTAEGKPEKPKSAPKPDVGRGLLPPLLPQHSKPCRSAYPRGSLTRSVR